MRKLLSTLRSLRRQGANGVAVKLLWGAIDLSISYEDAGEPEQDTREAIGFAVSAPDESED